jgi:menaquinone-dependent protoporphyrinogen IX oxidase
MVRFVKKQRTEPQLPEKRARFPADVRKVIDRFLEAAGWRPERVKTVAGATDACRDYGYTGWIGPDRFAGEPADELSSSASGGGR